VLQYTNPAFAAVFAVFVLGEADAPAGGRLSLLLSLLGVLLVARPGVPLRHGTAALDPVAVAIGLAAARCCQRGSVRRRAHARLASTTWWSSCTLPWSAAWPPPAAAAARHHADALRGLVLLGVG
jgi:drug/metabolite transporter (DMT)-like permease